MKILKFKFLAVALFLISAVQFGFVSCSDDIGIDNYYTSEKEYASDYLKNRSQYSEYVEILSRARGERGQLRLVDMLGTYGSYTVFAPTNEAVDEYLKGRGLSSVDELTVADCDTIALNSIIEQAYFTTDYSNATYPKANMLEHVMTISTDSLKSEKGDTVTLRLWINKTSLLTHVDDSVCNGVVHTVGKVVGTSNDLLDAVMEQDSTISLYTAALQITGIDDTLKTYLDEKYGFATEKARIDSCTWTNNALCIFTAAEYDNVAYPEKRYYNYTAFAVQDSILKEKYGVTKLLKSDAGDGLSLEELAEQLYKPVYPEDEGNNDYTSRNNYLNRFISYHIINRYGSYYTLTSNDGGKLSNNFNRRKYDIRDWYETLMPYSMMKISFPSGSQQGLYINRRGVQSRADERGVFVRGAKVSPSSTGPKQPAAINGIYHYIDDVIAYTQNVQDVVFNDRIRLDCSTLSPDFMTKLTDGETARGHSCLVAANNGRYGLGGQGATASSNVNHCIGFKAGFCRNFKYTDNTHIHVRMRVLSFWSYEGDEVTVKGPFDITITLPPVPKGDYEIRMMTCVGFTSRGIMQAYIDGIPQGIPFDMRPSGTVLFGYKDDTSLGDDDAITTFDKSVHNLGWMKGPGCYASGEKDSFSGTTFRNQNNTIRKVLGTFHTDGNSSHTLRLQQKMESGGEMNFDFIELCPKSVYNNEYFAEDKY